MNTQTQEKKLYSVGITCYPLFSEFKEVYANSPEEAKKLAMEAAENENPLSDWQCDKGEIEISEVELVEPEEK